MHPCGVNTPNFRATLGFFLITPTRNSLGWLGGVVVSVSDSRSRGPGFDSWPVHRQATTLSKLSLCHQGGGDALRAGR